MRNSTAEYVGPSLPAIIAMLEADGSIESKASSFENLVTTNQVVSMTCHRDSAGTWHLFVEYGSTDPDN